MSGLSKVENEEALQQQLALQQFSAAQTEISQLSQQISEFEIEKKEMEEVMSLVKKVEKERKCFYNVDGILIEMTADDVLPKLHENIMYLTRQVDTLAKECETKQTLLADFAIKKGLVRMTPQMQSQLQPNDNDNNKTNLETINESNQENENDD